MDASGPTLPRVTLRPAVQTDAPFLYHLWDDEARGFSFSGGPTVMDQHVAWLKALLTDPARWLFVAEEGGRSVGSARLDRLSQTQEAEVSVMVAPGERQRGLGTAILEALIGEARLAGLTGLIALVKDSNVGSRGAFGRVGFRVEEWKDGVVTLMRTLE